MHNGAAQLPCKIKQNYEPQLLPYHCHELQDESEQKTLWKLMQELPLALPLSSSLRLVSLHASVD